MNTPNNRFDDLRYKTGCFYTKERNKQIIIYLLKKYGIKKVVVSPGATNFALVGSMQHDPFFEMYSCVDERAAAYMAIGMAEKSKGPVVLSCTGATASRNYMAALTYAYQRNVPILVITSSLSLASVGHLKAQVTDRAHSPIDMIHKSYQFDNIKDGEDAWSVTVKCNEVISKLLLNQKPVLINVCTTYSQDFSVKKLPQATYIPTITAISKKPVLPSGNICVFIGSHKRFTEKEIGAVERFCQNHNAIVLADHTSGYSGKYRVNMALPFSQQRYSSKNKNVRLLIHLGEISGDYYSFDGIRPNEVWRVNPDGAYSDFFRRLTKVFKMEESDFFNLYAEENKDTSRQYFQSCIQESKKLYDKLPDIPFSNIWIAKRLSNKLPQNSQIHFGILNSLRSWDFFNLPESVESASNVGGFGIDGCVSSLVGAALCRPEKLYFGVVGDLTFYYDSNILLNKNLPQNIRLIVINNGRGIEFRNYCHPAMQSFGVGVEPYVAAAGHFGTQMRSAIIDLCKSSGIRYHQVSNIDEYMKIEPDILNIEVNTPQIVEIIISPEDDSNSLMLYRRFAVTPNYILKYVRSQIGMVKRGIKHLIM